MKALSDIKSDRCYRRTVRKGRLLRFALVGAAALCVFAGSVRAEMEPATPESQGVKSAAILAWLDACERAFPADEAGAIHGFVIVRHGKTVAEGSWRPFATLAEPHQLYSHSKSFTSAAVGLLVDDGKLDLDERVTDLFPESLPSEPSDNLRQLRVRDLLTMNFGSSKDHYVARATNWLERILSKPVESAPGTRFQYDSDATHLLAAAVERRAGRGMMDFLGERLFAPLGFGPVSTTCSPSGVPCGGWGMRMTTRDLAKFGQLYLQKGRWEGREVLSPEWVALASARQTWSGAIRIGKATVGSGGDWDQGYGFQFWRCRHGAYRADGAQGQLTIVLPEQDAVVSVHAGVLDMQKELDLVWSHLLPGMTDGALPEDPACAARLRDRIAALAIPAAGAAADDLSPWLGKTFTLAENPRGFASVRFDRAADGLWCALVTRAGEQRFPVGQGAWRDGTAWIDPEAAEWLWLYVGETRVAASGGVGKDGRFRLRAFFTGTTANLTLDISRDGAVTGSFFAMGGCPLRSK